MYSRHQRTQTPRGIQRDTPKTESQPTEQMKEVKKEEQKTTVKKEDKTSAKVKATQKEKKRIEAKKAADKVDMKRTSVLRKSARLAASKTEETEKREFKLSPCLTEALELELQQIMTKAWRVLPDTPNTEAEQVAIDKLKNEVGDTLKSVLAMNVSERILNVPRKLYAKITALSSMPPNWLTSFLDRYECSDCRFLDTGVKKAFVVKLKSYRAFDRVCALDMRKSRGVSLQVVPMCNFVRHPDEGKKTKRDVTKASSRNDDAKTKSESATTDKKTSDESKEKIKKEIVDKESKIDKDDNKTDTQDEKNGAKTTEDVGLKDEELDVGDISSILNDGVVLDECLGSDDE